MMATSASSKRLAGNPGRRPIVDEMQAVGQFLAPPETLSPIGKQFYEAMAAQMTKAGAASEVCSYSLELLSSVYAAFKESEKALKESGILDRSGKALSPELRAYLACATLLRDLLGKFGATPADRIKVKVDPPKDDADPMALTLLRPKKNNAANWG